MPAQNYGPILTRFHQIQLNENPWLWPRRIPLGAITALVGYGGEGKSFLACSIACTVSRGETFPDETVAPQGAVVVMAGEDLSSKLRARYEANGADLDALTLLEGQRIYTKSGPVETNITLRDIDLIRDAVNQTSSVKLLIIGPIGDFIPGINSDKDNEVRALLNPLAQLAKEKSLAVLLICHRKKGAGARADNAALGSVAFTAKARAVHHVILDSHDTANHFALWTKSWIEVLQTNMHFPRKESSLARSVREEFVTNRPFKDNGLQITGTFEGIHPRKANQTRQHEPRHLLAK